MQGLRMLYFIYSIWCGYTLAAYCGFLLSPEIPYNYRLQPGQICIRTITTKKSSLNSFGFRFPVCFCDHFCLVTAKIWEILSHHYCRL